MTGVQTCALPISEQLARELCCVHFNADEVRREINKDLGFSKEDRIEQARRMGVLCDIAGRYGSHVVADFVCPTPETREAFNADFVVWVDRIKEGRFEDTNKMFVPPEQYDYRVTTYPFDMVSYHSKEIQKRMQGFRRKLKVA